MRCNIGVGEAEEVSSTKLMETGLFLLLEFSICYTAKPVFCVLIRYLVFEVFSPGGTAGHLLVSLLVLPVPLCDGN
jgi:hypothetical protein